MKGFTLIELMIIVAICGILAAIAVPAYKDYQAGPTAKRVPQLQEGRCIDGYLYGPSGEWILGEDGWAKTCEK